MKIKSPFKDYYDHVAHMYGGGDPKFVYVRIPIDESKRTVKLNHVLASPFNGTYDDRYILAKNTYVNRRKHIIIAGNHYLLLSRTPPGEVIQPYKLFTEKNFPKVFEKIRETAKRYSWEYLRWSGYKDFEQGKRFPFLDEIARSVNAPVFMVESVVRERDSSTVTIESNIPILADYEIPSLITPEQMYQDISYYVANTMHVSPDLVVNDNMSNKEKIVQHGFDLKQSFRHRK